MGNRPATSPVDIGEFDFELTQYSKADPEAYLVKNHGREVAHLRLRHDRFTTWAWLPGKSGPVVIHEQQMRQGSNSEDRFETQELRDKVLAAGLSAVQRHLRSCRVNAVANEVSAPAPGMSPA